MHELRAGPWVPTPSHSWGPVRWAEGGCRGLSSASQGARRRIIVPRHKQRGLGKLERTRLQKGWPGGALG